ncbi:MAG TPA: hypothetical protein VFM46_19695 [Pseudomonadales bacterium]|nr:hypothetical protein [Pseudomonadales bacterium]
MLLELWEWLSTPASAIARKSGLLYEAIALRHRAQRCAPKWQAHIVQCHARVHHAVASLSQTQTLVVLGSGLLLEIPIEKLALQFERIYLVDMQHLKPVRALARRYPNLVLVELDLSGVLESLLNWKENLAPPYFSAPKLPVTNADLFISANLLSQLKQPVRKMIGDKMDEAALENYQKRITQEHWNWFSHLPGKKLIFTDVESQFFNTDGEVVHTDAGLLGRLPPPHASWWWDVAPLGEISSDFAQRMKIHAWLFESQADLNKSNLVKLSHYRRHRAKKQSKINP